MYKLKDGGFVLNLNTGEYFDEDSSLWEGYQDWLSQGNIPEQIYSLSELKENIISNIKSKRNSKIDFVTGDDRQKRLSMMEAIKINRKRSKGEQLTPEDEAEDFSLNKLSEYIESLSDIAASEINWVSDENRTMQELEAYDINSIEWPIYGQ